jgi:ADP-L-glycero-D-manno-heptose 6-epimerase
MKILVTGHKGFIGSHMVKALSDHKVITFEWQDSFPALDDVSAVIHIGGISSTTESNVEKIMEQNYDFSCKLLDLCLSKNINFQYSSSASVYGLKEKFTEDSPVDPRTPYAWSKYLFERYAATKYEIAKEKNLSIQGFRYFNVYGDGEEHKGNQASPYTQFLKQANNTGEIKVFVDSQNYLRDFVHVNKVVEVHKKFLNIKSTGVYNIGTGSARSFMEIASIISAQTGATIKEIPMPQELLHSYQKYTCADLTKLTKTINEHLSTGI